MSRIQELRQKYTEVTGKKPFGGWNEQELEARTAPPIGYTNADAPAENVPLETVQAQVDLEEKQRMEEAAKINSGAKSFGDPEYRLEPMFIDGKPFAIIGDKYVPWPEAQVFFQKERIKYEQAKLVELEKELAQYLQTN